MSGHRLGNTVMPMVMEVKGVGSTNRLISSVDFGDVIALDLLDTVHGEPPGEGDLCATNRQPTNCIQSRDVAT